MFWAEMSSYRKTKNSNNFIPVFYVTSLLSRYIKVIFSILKLIKIQNIYFTELSKKFVNKIIRKLK